MNLIDRIILEWSYKTEKGYPDLNNKQDLRIFESLFGFNLEEMAKKPFSFLSPEAQEVGKAIMAKLNIPEDEIASHSKNRIIVLTDIPRQQVFSALGEMGFERDSTTRGSSGGGYRTDSGIEIIHKPKSLTQLGGAGVGNETFVYEKIKNVLESNSPITVKIDSSNGPTLEYRGVVGVNHVGKEGERKGWKGDISLETSKGLEFISIKEDGPYRWASVMGRYKEFYQKFITKAYNGDYPFLKLTPLESNPRVLQMMNPDNGKPYGRIFILNHPQVEEDTYDMAFGQDHAQIVQRSFTDADFNLEGDTLTIKASRTMKDLSDFTDDDLPIIEFERNASKATATEGPFNRGIVVRTGPKKRMKKATERANNLVLQYDELGL